METTWIRKRREQLKLSQEELVSRLEIEGEYVSRSTLSHWETGRYNAPLERPEFRAALAKSLRMTEPELLLMAGYKLEVDYSEKAQRAANIIPRPYHICDR